ncbi:hypothetical protein BDQ17DRAFT_276767 [Cyathus striatus]|nr:hypothetical protein BDQ17DRAFT_276767 [Cyathus striatus]
MRWDTGRFWVGKVCKETPSLSSTILPLRAPPFFRFSSSSLFFQTVLTPSPTMTVDGDHSVAHVHQLRATLCLQTSSLSSPYSLFSRSSPTSMTAADKNDHPTPHPYIILPIPPRPNISSTYTSRQPLSIRYLCNIPAGTVVGTFTGPQNPLIGDRNYVGLSLRA